MVYLEFEVLFKDFGLDGLALYAGTNVILCARCLDFGRDDKEEDCRASYLGHKLAMTSVLNRFGYRHFVSQQARKDFGGANLFDRLLVIQG